MSEVTDLIRRYNEGEVARDVLVRELAAFPYKPSTPPPKRPGAGEEFGRWWLEVEDFEPDKEGTWEEVDRALNRRLLPMDVYLEVREARFGPYPGGSP